MFVVSFFIEYNLIMCVLLVSFSNITRPPSEHARGALDRSPVAPRCVGTWCQKCTSQGIGQRGIVSERRKSLQTKEPMPCRHMPLCSSECGVIRGVSLDMLSSCEQGNSRMTLRHPQNLSSSNTQRITQITPRGPLRRPLSFY